MQKHYMHLTPTEQRIAKLFLEGVKDTVIRTRLMIDHATFRVHLSNIREKLQCADLTDPVRLREKMIHLKKEATESQLAVLALYGNGIPYVEICRTLGINVGTAMNHVSQGCARLGITVKGIRRRRSVKSTLESLSWNEWKDDPMMQ